MPIDCSGFTGQEAALCRQSTGQTPVYFSMKPTQEVFTRTNARGEVEIGFRRGPVSYPLTGKVVPGFERVVWTLRSDGSATQTLWEITQWGRAPEVLNYSPQEFELLRVFGSLGYASPIPKGEEWNTENWSKDIVPITEADRQRAVDTIRSLSAVDILGLYYSLWEIEPPKVGKCGRVKRLDITTPPQASDDRGYALFQYPIMGAIYRLRPELREVYDPATGNKIPGLLPPDRLPEIPCLVSKSKWDIVADLALTVIGLGFPGPQWASAMMSIVQAADQFRSMKDDFAAQKKLLELNNFVTRGAEAIMTAPPKPPGPMEVLESRAEGKTPPPASQAQGGAFPWWLVAGTAALLLS